MHHLRPTAVLLAACFLLCGCTAPERPPDASPPPSPGPLTGTAAPVPNALPSRTPVTGSAPAATPTAEGFEFVTVEEAVPGLAGESDSLPATITWAEQYCRFAYLTPCAGIEDRGVPLCIEKWDCHPALLVEFQEGTAAFLHGGIFPDPLVFAV